MNRFDLSFDLENTLSIQFHLLCFPFASCLKLLPFRHDCVTNSLHISGKNRQLSWLLIQCSSRPFNVRRVRLQH